MPPPPPVNGPPFGKEESWPGLLAGGGYYSWRFSLCVLFVQCLVPMLGTSVLYVWDIGFPLFNFIGTLAPVFCSGFVVVVFLFCWDIVFSGVCYGANLHTEFFLFAWSRTTDNTSWFHFTLSCAVVLFM